MATMNISLPEQMKAWVDSQSKSGRYGNASDYVRDLIRRDQDRQARLAELQQLIDEGVDSGVSSNSLDDLLAEARRRAGTNH
ncbi:type II toxin-antitoxin system ParD family antitoxin [Fodinicurvata halophila]|uniref:Type II toxin-antitoxin system ParD family antitoxin n=1 Tax=Fodinicurvata halophila TaxID=1419723 RepID=A0ABV8UP32_9PROT